MDGSRVMGPEGALDTPARGATEAAFDAEPWSCGIDAAPGELIELSFGDERFEESMAENALGEWAIRGSNAPSSANAHRSLIIGHR